MQLTTEPAIAGMAAAGVGILYLVRHRHLRASIEAGRFRLRYDHAN